MTPVPPVPGFKKALDTFQKASQRVPAYRDFLKRHHIDPTKIITLADFSTIPPITKENYLRYYPLPDLLWDGDTTKATAISMSSGSSGTPSFWLRGNKASVDSILLHDTIFDQSFQTREKRTLLIIAFAMGTWIAGTYTYTAAQELANNGHKLTVITPGINKAEIVYILRNLSAHFEQTIIAGYPPFVKDALEEAEAAGLNLSKLNLRLLFAGEGFSETWRDYVLNKINKKNDLYATACIYGTADAGMMAHENPFSIFTRRQALANPTLYQELFPDTTAIPTFARYDPELRFIQEQEGYFLFTIDTASPLIRYQIMDQGRLLSGAHIEQLLTQHKIKIPETIRSSTKESYLALSGRSDLCTTFYALDIYPENIRYGLEKCGLDDKITGKFTLVTQNAASDQSQTLHLYVEMKPDIPSDPSLKRIILRAVVESLRTYNTEYNRLYQEIRAAARPHIHLRPHNSKEFVINIKHRWTPKN